MDKPIYKDLEYPINENQNTERTNTVTETDNRFGLFGLSRPTPIVSHTFIFEPNK